MSSICETWKPVKGFDGLYEVSSAGQVRVLPHTVRHWCGREIQRPCAMLRQSRHSGGYRVVSLRGAKYYVHRLVMEAFVGPGDGMDVNHIDGNKDNNRLDNLEYCDRLHNVRHAMALGLINNAGEANGMSRHTEAQIRTGHALVSSGMTYREAAKISGVSCAALEAACAGRTWRRLGLEPLVRRGA